MNTESIARGRCGWKATGGAGRTLVFISLTVLCLTVPCYGQSVAGEQEPSDSVHVSDEPGPRGVHVVTRYPDLDSLRREHAKLSHYLQNPDVERWFQSEGGGPIYESESADTIQVDGRRKLRDGYRVQTIDLKEGCQIVETRGDISSSYESISRVLYCEEDVAFLAGYRGRQGRTVVITREMRRIGLDVITNAVGNFQSLDDHSVECGETESGSVRCNIIDHPCESVTRPYGSHWIMEFNCDFRP